MDFGHAGTLGVGRLLIDRAEVFMIVLIVSPLQPDRLPGWCWPLEVRYLNCDFRLPEWGNKGHSKTGKDLYSVRAKHYDVCSNQCTASLFGDKHAGPLPNDENVETGLFIQIQGQWTRDGSEAYNDGASLSFIPLGTSAAIFVHAESHLMH